LNLNIFYTKLLRKACSFLSYFFNKFFQNFKIWTEFKKTAEKLLPSPGGFGLPSGLPPVFGGFGILAHHRIQAAEELVVHKQPQSLCRAPRNEVPKESPRSPKNSHKDVNRGLATGTLMMTKQGDTTYQEYGYRQPYGLRQER
jgi:hypothetical protein